MKIVTAIILAGSAKEVWVEEGFAVVLVRLGFEDALVEFTQAGTDRVVAVSRSRVVAVYEHMIHRTGREEHGRAACRSPSLAAPEG